MNIIDIGIVIFIIFGAILGFKRGFTTEILKAAGGIIVVVLAYFLKNPLSVYLYEHLPFFDFGFLKGAAILNILLYEIIAFIICVALLTLALKILTMVTRLFEKLLNATIVLGIPSKIAGAIVGLLYDYIIVFIILYVLTLVGIDASLVNESKLTHKILNETPVLSSICDDSVNVIKEFTTLKDDYNDKSISQQDFEYRGMELFLRYNIITSTSARKLIADGKIDSFDYYEDLLNKYEVVE